MKNYLFTFVCLLILGGIKVALPTAAQNVQQVITKSVPLNATPISNDEVAYAPKDGYYLVDRAEDCVVNGKYVFGSSILAQEDALLFQDDERSMALVHKLPMHICNGDALFSAPSSAIWHFIPNDNGDTFLENDKTKMYLAASNKNDAHQYDVFTVGSSKLLDKDIKSCFKFSDLSHNDYANTMCDEGNWLGLSIFRYVKNNPKRYWIEWDDDTQKFRKYSGSYVGARSGDNSNYVCPPRIYRFFSQGERLPSSYIATQRINFTEAGYRTFYAEHAYMLPETLRAYYAQLHDNTLNLYPILGAIPARTAVILYKDAPGDVALKLTFEEVAPLTHRNDLRGVGHLITLDEVHGAYFDYYALTREEELPNNYYFARCEADIPIGKSVIPFEKKTVSNQKHAKKLKFVVHDLVPMSVNSLDISNVTSLPRKTQQSMWDLQGRRIHKAHHGQLYIQDGHLKVGE